MSDFDAVGVRVEETDLWVVYPGRGASWGIERFWWGRDSTCWSPPPAEAVAEPRAAGKYGDYDAQEDNEEHQTAHFVRKHLGQHRKQPRDHQGDNRPAASHRADLTV